MRPPSKPSNRRINLTSALGLALMATVPGAAHAQVVSRAPIDIHAANTFGAWRNIHGGLSTGNALLNRFDLSVTLHGEAWGRPGLTGRLLYHRIDGDALSGDLVGDVQGVDNISASGAHRLMEAWVEQDFGDRGSVRAGLMDLNAEFDGIEPAGLFLNSSHGIGAEIAQSGRNGPSIYPTSALGIRGELRRGALAVRAAAFDGVPGDLDRPEALAAVDLAEDDGALIIGQADVTGEGGLRVSMGVWRYTESFAPSETGERRSDRGAYASIEGPLAPRAGLSGWVRVGVSGPKPSAAVRQFSGGVVMDAPWAGRPRDQIGFAVTRAEFGGASHRAGGQPDAETAFELTYRYVANDWLSLQPNLQYVVGPASAPGLDNAVVLGLRVTLTTDRLQE